MAQPAQPAQPQLGDWNYWYDVHAIPGKGQGMIARRNIPTGTIIITDPILFFRLEDEKVFGDAMNMRFGQLTLAQRTAFNSLSEDANDTQRIRQENPKWGVGRVRHASIYGCNHFAVPDWLVGEGRFQHNKENMVEVVLHHISRVCHSCVPNVTSDWGHDEERGDWMALTTIKNVKEGEELVWSYDATAKMSTAERQKIFGEWGFECQCPACMLEAFVRYTGWDNFFEQRLGQGRIQITRPNATRGPESMVFRKMKRVLAENETSVSSGEDEPEGRQPRNIKRLDDGEARQMIADAARLIRQFSEEVLLVPRDIPDMHIQARQEVVMRDIIKNRPAPGGAREHDFFKMDETYELAAFVFDQRVKYLRNNGGSAADIETATEYARLMRDWKAYVLAMFSLKNQAAETHLKRSAEEAESSKGKKKQRR